MLLYVGDECTMYVDGDAEKCSVSYITNGIHKNIRKVKNVHVKCIEHTTTRWHTY